MLNKYRQLYPVVLLTVAFTLIILGLGMRPSFSKAATNVKISYNGRTKINKSKKLTVKYNDVTISKKSYKALKINKTYMVPYIDVFKKGAKANCKYNKSKKSITIKANGSTLKMTIGSKTAYLNDKKVTMSSAPLSVRYVKKKKTKILVPVAYVAKALNYSYKKADSTISINDPLKLKYDGKSVYYTGVQGDIYYNHNEYTLSTMPVIKISGKMYIPAKEVFQTIMGLEYSYDSSSKKVQIDNDNVDLTFTGTVGSTDATINDTAITLTAPIKLIRNKSTKKSIVCVPATSILGQLNYSASWKKAYSYYQIQSKSFFNWTSDLTQAQQSTSSTNYLYDFKSTYEEDSGTGAICFALTGTDDELLKSITINRTGNKITVTIPTASYILDSKSFSNFGEIVNSMEVSENDGTVSISLICENVADYTYTMQDNTLTLKVLYTYKSSDGSVTSYSMSISKPSDVTISDVTNQDLYQKKKFKIKIKGDYVSYFQNNPVVINSSSVKNVTVKKNSSNKTVITVTTSSLMGYKIYESGNKLQVKIGTPKSIYKNIIVLDAGHGGKDPGAQNNGTDEKDLTYKIIYTLMKSYFSDNAPDTKVYWTRTTDTYVTLANRAAFASSVGADAFISLHMNSATSSSANGTEVYYSVSNNSSSFGGITSKKMANLFRKNLISDLGTKNRGTKTAAYYVLKYNSVPSILIELGFISGSTDYSKLISSDFQKKAAKSIYTSINTMFNTYSTGR